MIISIHALREEGDAPPREYAAMLLIFLSTPSARRATRSSTGSSGRALYFYPRPPRGGRRWPRSAGRTIYFISIHALREEGDTTPSSTGPTTTNFYPRPPRGGRLTQREKAERAKIFLSTPSARRATAEMATNRKTGKFLSTPSARRATLHYDALLANVAKFLSTPSARRATQEPRRLQGVP